MAALVRKNKLLTLDRVSVVLGFAFTIIGLLGTQFYLQPSQQHLSDVNQQIGADRLKAHLLTNANGLQYIFSQLGSLIFSLDAHDQPNDTAYDAVAALQVRALDWRHAGTRTYFAALGSAGEIDFQSVTQAYQQLVAKELADPQSFEAFKNVNSFENDVVMKAVGDKGNAMMEAINARPSFWKATAEANYRASLSALVGVAGTTMIFIATMLGERKSAAPVNTSPLHDTTALIKALEEAHSEVGRLLATTNQKNSTGPA